MFLSLVSLDKKPWCMGSGGGSGPEPGEIRAGSLARSSADTGELIKADGVRPPIFIVTMLDLDMGLSFLVKSYRFRASS